MEKLNIEIKKVSEKEDGKHQESLDFVDRNKDILEHYAKGRVNIEQAYKGLDTFAFNLNTNTIYVNDMFYKNSGFSEEKTIFAVLHELEHFTEKKQILEEEGGERVFKKYLQKKKKSKAFGLMDNCISDIRENRAVISRTNEGMRDLEKKLYKENLFEEIDFTKLPKHIQFCQAILRESRVPEEECLVCKEVRQKINELKKVENLIEIMTNPETPMSLRLRLQDKYVWPIVEELLGEDIEDKKKKDNETREKQSKGEKNEEKTRDKDSIKDDGNDLLDPDDPNKIFKDEYDEIENKFPEAMPLEDIEKAFKEWQERKKENSGDKADEDYAEKIGVDKKYLQNYRKEVENLNKILSPETNIPVIEDLKNLFSRIISKRLNKVLQPKYPVEEGDELVDPALLVADVKAGNLEPKAWEDLEIKEKKEKKFGDIEITLVCDRSSSMEDGGGQKAVEQRRSAVLIMEALNEFATMCEEDKIITSDPLEVRSEIYGFSSSEKDKIPLKKMSSTLGEAERVNVLKSLYYLTGSTTDFVCLETINDKLDEEAEKKIKEGLLKKIIIVLTDGISDDPARVQSILKVLKEKGIVVVGIGLTSSGQPAKVTYAPDSMVVENIKTLPVKLAELLKEHLRDI